MQDQIPSIIVEQAPQIMENAPLLLEWGMRLLSAAIILIAGRMIGNWLSNRIKSIKKLDDTLAGFLSGFAKYVILTVALVTVLGQFGVQTASLLAVLGAAGLAIGLALQGTLSNVASGTMLLILRPFKVGDFITAGGVSGTVKALGLFGTELATPDNVYIFVPNSRMWGGDIHNFSRNSERRQDIIVGISYNDDIDKAFKTVQKTLDKEKRILTKEGKEPLIMVSNMGDFAIDLTARIWTKREDFASVKADMNKALKEALDKDGITIPFPTRTIEMVNTDSGSKAVAKKKAA